MQSSFNIIKDDIELRQAVSDFSRVFQEAGGSVQSSGWDQLAKKYGPRVNRINQENEWYDIFLIDNDGNIVYTDTRESDLGLNLLRSQLSASSFGIAFAEASRFTEDDIAVSDFSPYAPSNDAPAAFMVSKIFNQESRQAEGYIAFQVPLGKVNRIMIQRDGMGETGESYLVGPDLLMRSDSYLDPEGHSVAASFAGNVKNNGVDSDSSQAALRGETGSAIIIDYNGNPVLSAYTPLAFGKNNWALLVEVDEAEAFSAAKNLASRSNEVTYGLCAACFTRVVSGACCI
jgi:methyl-accepting chemotaxis protein